MSDRWHGLREALRAIPFAEPYPGLRDILDERDQLLAALTELIAAAKQAARVGSEDDLMRVEIALEAAERLIAGDAE